MKTPELIKNYPDIWNSEIEWHDISCDRSTWPPENVLVYFLVEHSCKYDEEPFVSKGYILFCDPENNFGASINVFLDMRENYDDPLDFEMASGRFTVVRWRRIPEDKHKNL